MSYEQRLIVLFIVGVNGVISPEDKISATNLILTAYDKSQVDRIKKQVDVLKSPSMPREQRESMTKELVAEILRSGESLKEGAD